MSTSEITDALIVAQISIRYGKPMSDAERADAVKALRAVRVLDGPERVAIHEAVIRGVKLCAGMMAA